MSTRIHKILGWGLSDINNSIEEDERLDSEACCDYDKLRAIDEFLDWVKNNGEEAKEVKKKVDGEGHGCSFLDITFLLSKKEDGTIDKSKIHDFLTYDSEFGNSSVMIFCPITAHDWYRYDDIIDYYEAGCGVGEGEVNVLTNCCGIWPYSTSMIHIPGSPKYGEEGFPESMMGGDYNREIGVFSKEMRPILKGDDLDYYKKYYRPSIAPSLILHLYWLKIFTNFYETIHELRPMIYTYWS